MEKTLFALALIIISLGQAYGQETPSCGMPPMDSVTFVNKPWIGNNQFLLDILDSVFCPGHDTTYYEVTY